MYKVENTPFDFDTAELACIYIEKYKSWMQSCISLHPNVECKYLFSEDSIPVIEIEINDEYDLFQQKGLNVKVIVGENGCGKTSILKVLSNNIYGGIAVLKDSVGHFVSNRKIKIKKNDSDIISLDKYDPSGFSSINDAFLPNVIAENDSEHRIQEEPFIFKYRFLSIYQANPKLYDFAEDDPVFTHFSIKPLPSFKEYFSNYFDTYILPSGSLQDDFEDCLKTNPLEMILLAQMTSDNYWSDFGEEWAEREDGDVYFGDLIDYQENRFFETQKVKELKEKYASKLKNMIFDENGYKEYDLKNDFMKINLEWRGEKGVLDSIYNEMKGIFASPQLELFYYYGFKWMGADRFDFESFSDGEQKFIKLKYDIYPGLTQDLTMGRFWHVLDEPETFLHPEWSRFFWKNFIETFEFLKNLAILQNEEMYKKNTSDIASEEAPIFEGEEGQEFAIREVNVYKENVEILKKRRFSIIISTHSPFILSDLFSHNIVYLEKQKRGNIYYSAVKKSRHNTFAGNIGEMFYDYFLKNAIGAIAEEEIINAVKYRQKKNPDEDTSPEKDKYEAVVNNIGDPVIRSLIEEVDVEDSCEDNDGEEK